MADYSFYIDLAQEWCAICLKAENIDYFVLGVPFLKGMYTTFDYSTMQVKYVPYQGSAKAVPVKGSSAPSVALPGTEAA